MARKQKMSQLCEGLSIYPQVLQNVRVADKAEALANPGGSNGCGRVTAELGDTGRILVRESATEPVIRVMVEAERGNLPEICGYGRRKIKIKVNAKDNIRKIQKLCENIMQLLLLSVLINE